MLEPGDLPAPHDQFRIILGFRERFRTNEPKGTLDAPGWLAPSWTAFSAGASRLENSVLHRLRLGDTSILHLLVEYPYPGHILRARLGDLKRFFDVHPDHERPIIPRYVFPQDFSWCIAFTNEHDGRERLVMGEGTLPFADDA
jgi:hypothetical protein